MTPRSLIEESPACSDLELSLHPFVDGELEGDDRAELAKHLSECQRCREEVELLAEYKARMRAVSSESTRFCAPEGLAARLGLSLEREARARGRRSWLPYVGWPVGLAAAAACLVLVVVSYNSYNGRERTRALVDASVTNHRRQLPMEVSDASIPQVRSWFEGKLGFAPNRIPQLGTAERASARLSNLKEREAAYVLFGGPDRRRVSLFVFDAPDLQIAGERRVADRDVLIANQQGYNVAIWKDRGVAYSLVSELEERDILELIATSASQGKGP